MRTIDPARIERYRRKFTDEVAPQLLARLDETPAICGEHFTAADGIIAQNVYWARGYRLCQDGTFRKYLSRVSKRPAFISAFSDTRLFEIERPLASASAG